MASRSRNVYIGITDDIYRRALEHKKETIDGFTKRYRINRRSRRIALFTYLNTSKYLAEGWGDPIKPLNADASASLRSASS